MFAKEEPGLWHPSHSDRELKKGAKWLPQFELKNLRGIIERGHLLEDSLYLTDEAVDKVDLAIALAH
jgi:hypothetical protein